MFSIVIDFSKIILHSKLTLLEKKIKPFPKNLNYKIGLILTIPNNTYDLLLKQKFGMPRINFINSPLFVNSIIDFTYIQYDPKRKICEIQKINSYTLSSILDSILYYIPNDFKILISITIENKKLINKCIYESFKNPHISNKSPLGIKYNTDMLFLNKINNIVTYDATNEVNFAFKNYKNKTNILQFKLNNETIKKLKYFSKLGNSINNDDTITQKEISGCFKIQNMDNNFIYNLELCDNIKLGLEEEAEILNCKISFHSHPYSLYDIYKFKFGWPSNFDYMTYLHSIKNTLFHIVVTNEGIYIISLSKEWSEKEDFTITNEIQNFILKNYKIKKTNNFLNVQEYIKKINKIKYKNTKIFNLQFQFWNQIENPFYIFQPKNIYYI